MSDALADLLDMPQAIASSAHHTTSQNQVTPKYIGIDSPEAMRDEVIGIAIGAALLMVGLLSLVWLCTPS